MKGTQADSFKLSVEDGKVVVEFGRSSERDASGAGSVALSDRIDMPLRTAKRLVHSLNDCLARHSPQPGSADDPRRGETPVNAPPDPAGEKAALLLKLIGELAIPYQYERSFRLSQGELLANRFLLSLNAADIPGSPRERALEICDRLAMPAGLRRSAAERFPMASCVHFGFEGGADSIVCKLYLERVVPADEVRRARASGVPVLLHLAFKWDLVAAAEVVTEYRWYPALDAPGIERRLSEVYRGAESQPSLAIASAVLQLAAGRAAPERLQYLEVQEPANGRRSFDLNAYDAGLQVKDLQPALQRMRERYGVRPGDFQALYDQIKAKPFGHLAGGVHRNGRDFFNVYYGVVGLPRFHQQFR
jgi:hypothetical protein